MIDASHSRPGQGCDRLGWVGFGQVDSLDEVKDVGDSCPRDGEREGDGVDFYAQKCDLLCGAFDFGFVDLPAEGSNEGECFLEEGFCCL
jgi:hypothetical protein